MLYLIQVICYTGLLSLVYILLLRNKAVHTFNRAYLLFTAVLPLVLPFIELSGMQENIQAIAITSIQLPELNVAPELQKTATTGISIFWLVYIGISVSVAIVAAWKWYSLKRFIAKQASQQRDGYVLLTNTGYGPGSWRRYIILPDETINETVIDHELAHIRLHHTRDVVFLTILQVFFWPNIFLIWLKKELTQVHEFQADAAVAGDERAYAELLLSNVFHTCTLPQTHSFIIHPIKRRIMMLKKQGKKTRALTFVLTTIAVGFLLTNIIGLQSCKRKTWEVKDNQEKTAGKGDVLRHVAGTKDYTLFKKFAEKMPEFPGGREALVNFLTENIQYPEEARKKNIEGKVFVQFYVDVDGSVLDPYIRKSPDTLLSQAALQLVNKMPKWIPAEEKGKKVPVMMTLPVLFKLS